MAATRPTDAVRNALRLVHLKAQQRRFSGASITGFGDLGEPETRFGDFDDEPIPVGDATESDWAEFDRVAGGAR